MITFASSSSLFIFIQFDTTLLHEAVSRGNVQMVEVLLQNGAKVNETTKVSKGVMNLT